MNSRADATIFLVKRLDSGIGAMPLGLRRKREDDNTSKQSAERGNERQEPGARDGLNDGSSLTGGIRRKKTSAEAEK